MRAILPVGLCFLFGLPSFAQANQGAQSWNKEQPAIVRATATPNMSSEQYLMSQAGFNPAPPAPIKPELKEPILPAPEKKQYFVGGGGVKHLGEQLAFPVRHPVKFGNNCSHPFRHPLVAFGQFSHWVEPYNSGLSACSSIAGIAGSAALQRLWTLHNTP
jgi:hypothetical protein